MKVTLKKQSIPDSKEDVKVLAMFEDETKLPKETEKMDKDLKGLIKNYAIKQEKFDAKLGEVLLFTATEKDKTQKIAILGLGKRKELSYDQMRTIGVKLYKKFQSQKNVKTIAISTLSKEIAELDDEKCAQNLTDGIIAASYEFTKYKTAKKEDKFSELVICEEDEKVAKLVKAGIKIGEMLANAQNSARDLINDSAKVVTPQYLAKFAKGLKGINTTVYHKAEVEKMGMNAFLAVGSGSVNPPELIHMVYKPEKKAKRKLAFIGKGITFDSGGLDIKPAASMLTMKDDMSGAAAILMLMQTVAQLKPNLEIHGIIAACENMPSGSSYKPGDVLTAKNGKTIEVDNTDAEGRITLADALCFAEEQKVDEIIDIATLTGACVVALGTFVSGVMGNNQALIDRIIECAYNSGEKYWQLPMYEEYGKVLESDVADMKNTGSRFGGASSAGVFLNNFVAKTPWCHIDIAGTAFLDKKGFDGVKCATGVGVKTLINYVRSI